MAIEAELQKIVLAWLKQHNIEHWRMPLGPIFVSGGLYKKNHLKGFPDIMGLCKRRNRGVAWAIELKASSRSPVSAEQKAWMERLKESGAFVRVVLSLDEAIVFFREIGEI